MSIFQFFKKKDRRPVSAHSPAGDVWIADVVRAWRTLRAHTPEEKALIAGILGFDLAIEGQERRRLSRDVPARPVTTTLDPATLSATATATTPVKLPLEQFSERPAQSEQLPQWLRIDEPVEAERAEHLDVRPPHQPLFQSGWTRAILSAACATTAADGPIQVDRVIETLANGRPVTALPRDIVHSLRRGMQLLVDRGESMMPFARDTRDLQQQLVLVVGRDRSQVLYFDGCPTLGGGPGARSTWKARYEPPAAEVPIVVISDFAMSRGSQARGSPGYDAWSEFLRIAHAAGCPVVAFAPFPLSRWPAAIAAAVRAIPWDRPTTVSAVLQAGRRDRHG